MSLMASDGKGPLGHGSPGEPWSLARLGDKRQLGFLVAAVAAFAFAYAPNFRELFSVWSSDPNYQHGFLVIPIALMIVWNRVSGESIRQGDDKPSMVWPSAALLAVVLLTRAVAYERGSQWTETATMIPALACLVGVFGGWRLLRTTWPALAFLIFLLPLPRGINSSITLPLQRIAATGSCFLLQLTGLWAIQQGNVIVLDTTAGTSRLDVEQACSGLKMLMTLAATITATILLIPMPGWKRVVLLASAVPIALASNIIRIVSTGWGYYLLTGEAGQHAAHDWAGYLMMPVALVMVGLELWILSWLIEEEAPETGADRAAVLSRIAGRTS